MLASFVLVACDPPDVVKLLKPVKEVEPIKKSEPVKRNLNPEQLSRGAVLFQKNCAECHGAQGQGVDNWQKRGADGKFPAPPLNGLGHTWHHPTVVLKYTINNGTGKIGGNMPAFAAKLTDNQIDDILIFIQEKWPAPIYEAWYRTNERAHNKTTK
ncbi:MAG: cytochrome c [Sulfuriflexus sp.]|nr:cytochrome c [Sulfuriflexus sp.]